MPNIQFGKIPIFPSYRPAGGYQKRQKALKMLRFLYGGSSIHWPPKLILSSSIFSHLFPFKFFPYISISIFISHISPIIFLSLKNFFHPQIFPIISNSIQFGKKFFYMPAQIPRILYNLPSLHPLILSLNKYSQSRIILEIS